MILDFGNTKGLDYERWASSTLVEDCRWLLGKYWKRVGFFALAGFLIAVGYNRWSPEEYVSRATVRFIPPQVSESFVASNVAMQVEQRIFAVTQLVDSRLTATQMIETFGLYPQKRRFYPVADIVPEFQRRLLLTTQVPQGDTKAIPSISISFRYGDADKAQRVVQRIVELIYEENRRYRSDQSIGTTDFLGQELKAVTEQMQSLEQRLAELPTPGGEDKEYRNILKVENLHDLERRVTEIQHDMSWVLVERNLRKTQVESMEAQMKSRAELGTTREASYSIAADRVLDRLNLATARYDELRGRYKSGNAELVAAERAVAHAKEELAAQQQKDREMELDRDLSTLSAQLGRAKSELAGYETTLQKETSEEAQLTAEINRIRSQFSSTQSKEDERLQLMREYESTKSHYAELTRKQRDSQVASDMERRGHGETAELVEPPTYPMRAEYPTALMVLSEGGVLGALVGYALALFSFLRAPRVRLVQHIQILGAYPVLACLPNGPLPGESAGSSRKKNRLAESVLTMIVLLAAVLTGCQTSPLTRRASEFEAGRKALQAGDYRTAEIRFLRAIQADKRFGDAYLQLADVYLAEAQPLKAYEQLVRAGELLPDRPDVTERLGEFTYQIYFADPGRPAATLREVEHIAETLRTKWPARPTGYRLAGQVLIERHHSEEAIELMEQALTHLEDGPLRTQLAAAYYQLGERIKAEEHLRITIKANPKYSPGFDLLYLQLMERGEVASARAVLAEKVRIEGGVDPSLQLAAHDDAAGSRSQAEARLIRLSEDYSQDALVPAKIGDFWMHRGELAKARDWYETGLRRFPKERGVYTGRKAELLMAQKDPDGARALVADELAARPNDPLLKAYQAAFGLDGQNAQERRHMQAELESVLAQMPNSPFVRLHLGRAYLLNGDLLKAGEQLRSTVSLDPNYAPGWLALAELELTTGDTGLAQEQLAALLRRAPGYLPAQLLKAQASLAQHKPEEAEKTLNTLLDADPQNVDVMMALARAKVNLGHAADAVRLLERSQSLRPSDPRPLLLLARLYVARGDAKSALERLLAATPSMAQSPDVEELTGSVALLAAQNQIARAKFESLLAKDPENLKYRLGYATSLSVLGENGKAKEQFLQVQKKAGGDPQPWLLYGVMMSSSGNTPAAAEAYQEALKRDSKNPFALNNLAFLMAREGKELDRALALAEEARRGMPRSREIHDTLAYIYVRLGMKRNAAAALEELAVNQPASQQERTRALVDEINRGNLTAVREQMERASVGLN
jgi:tetratricopeptide (TPR) repeat protein